jgi:integrase/recombinase XerD
VSLETANVYAEIDFETKARALATCEAAGTSAARLRWRDQPALMDFLRSL